MKAGLLCLLLLTPSVEAKFLIVIDPGHGGSDTGALFETHKEKDLALLLAQDLKSQLTLKGNEAILTRNKDIELPLIDRTNLANRLKANLFISLHMNSSMNQKQKAGGIETYILNRSSDTYAKRLAEFENSETQKPSTPQKTQSLNLDRNITDIILESNIEPSRRLAQLIQSKTTKSTINRGTKQALFHVLLHAKMPSVLIEAGFINALDDRDKIIKERRRIKLAIQITEAIEEFKKNKKIN